MIFWDTSAIFAFVNDKDPAYEQVKECIFGLKNENLIITNYIFDEIITLVQSRLGHKNATIIGSTLLNSPQVQQVWIQPADTNLAWQLFANRKDKQYSFTDCTSFITMKRMQVRRYLSLDKHFQQEGFESILLG